ncbi:acylneuraminate cytidylyltransferase family protein [Vibrio splendidus]
MINGKKVLALIPARGGSKRLPRKNVLPFSGKPLIGWTIDAANGSRYIDKIFVSTDDNEIMETALDMCVDVPELRPKELASDLATTDSVIDYTLKKYGKGFDVVILLQPTSPLRTSKQIDEALELLIKNDALSIVSVCACEHSPLWANTIEEDGSMNGFITEDNRKRAQELKQYYRLNGAIYIYKVEEWFSNKGNIYNEKSYAYIMNSKCSIDIDELFDFKMAELVLNFSD